MKLSRSNGAARSLRLPILLLLTVFWWPGTGSAQSLGDWAEIRIVAHPDNETRQLTRGQLAALYMGKLDRWPDGSEARPMDLVDEHPLRAVFSKLVHRRTVREVEKAWLRLMLRGRELPPRLADPGEVLDAVRADRRKVGYVPASADVEDFTVLQIVEDPVLKRKVEPVYTQAARRAGVRGIVVLKVMVKRNGAVGLVVPVRSLPHGLTSEAIRAVKQWFYEPASLDGKPVKATIEVAIRFRP